MNKKIDELIDELDIEIDMYRELEGMEDKENMMFLISRKLNQIVFAVKESLSYGNKE